jgi:Cdc6-like AAA superfamily ATPase
MKMEWLEERRIIGREKELTHIRNFLNSHLEQKKGGSLYVCGRSGTGKTEAMRQIYEGLQKFILTSNEQENKSTSKRSKTQPNIRLCWLNGSAFGASFSSTLANELCLTSSTVKSNAETVLERNFRDQTTMFVVVTDEIDLLPPDTVRKLFSWATEKSSFILIGIANVVNAYADLFKLQISPPEELPFPPYDAKQLFEIVRVKIGPEKSLMFQPEALEYASKKAKSGDVRQLLSVCEKSLIQAGVFSKPDKKVTMLDVVRAVASQCIYSRIIQDLPVQCRFAIVACTIAASSNNEGSKPSEQEKLQPVESSKQYPQAVDEKQVKDAWNKLREWWKIPIEGDIGDHLRTLRDNQLLETVNVSSGAKGKQKSNSSSGKGPKYKILPNRDEILDGLIAEEKEEEQDSEAINQSSSKHPTAEPELLKRRPIIMAFNGIRPARMIANMHAPMAS